MIAGLPDARLCFKSLALILNLALILSLALILTGLQPGVGGDEKRLTVLTVSPVYSDSSAVRRTDNRKTVKTVQGM